MPESSKKSPSGKASARISSDASPVSETEHFLEELRSAWNRYVREIWEIQNAQQERVQAVSTEYGRSCRSAMGQKDEAQEVQQAYADYSRAWLELASVESSSELKNAYESAFHEYGNAIREAWTTLDPRSLNRTMLLEASRHLGYAASFAPPLGF